MGATALYFFLIGAAGAAAYELIRLYELMSKLPRRKFAALLRSPLYASVTLGMVVASGFIAWGINANSEPTAWQLIISGIGARSLISKPAEIHFARGPTLGANVPAPEVAPSATPKVTLRDLFR